MPKAFVLLSGGIDSTTCLYIAANEFNGVIGVSIDYGQRHKKEIEYARRSCAAVLDANHNPADHHVIDLSSVIPKTMLTDSSEKIPEVAYSEIEGVSPTYVPFRNGLMLSAVASYAAGMVTDADNGESAIYFGAHAEDAQNWAYPDCTFEFAGAMGNAIFVGTYHQIRLHVPLIWMVKSEIIRKGAKLGVDFRNTFSCYVGGEKHCGVCPTCRSRRQGFIDAGVVDPTEYAQ